MAGDRSESNVRSWAVLGEMRHGDPDEAHVPLMDALRGIAAGMIFLFHALPRSDLGALEPYADQLSAGVPIFFLISSYLLYRSFASASLQGRAPRLGRYAWRRAMRLVPAYWLVLTVTVVIGSHLTVSGTLPLYGFAQVYIGHPLRGIGAAWSLDVEVALYALLPVLAAVALVLGRGSARAQAVVIASIGIAGLAFLAWYAAHFDLRDTASARYQFLPPFWFFTFAVGTGLALASVLRRDRGLPPLSGWRRTLAEHPAACWALGIAAYVATVELAPDTRATPESMLHVVLLTAFAFFLLAPAIFGHSSRGRLRAALASRPAQYLGTVSYGIFLWHLPIVGQLEHHLPDGTPARPVAILVLAAAATLVAATLSWVLLERPAIALAHRRRAAPGSAAVRAPVVAGKAEA